MKILSTPVEINNETKRLISDYGNYYLAVAWASINSEPFSMLAANRLRIKKMVVGLHFYQTHPDFIQEFIDDRNVRFIKQPSGTFHPKVYLFFNNIRDWEAIIGSSNFTNDAFTRNTEFATLIGPKDDIDGSVYRHLVSFTNKCWESAERFDHAELTDYRNAWLNFRTKIDSLSGWYGAIEKENLKPSWQVPIMRITWKDFVKNVLNDRIHGVNQRLLVLDVTKQLFSKVSSFRNLSNDERKFIAGIPHKLNINGNPNSGLFGSMKGAGIFKNKIIQNDINLSNAIDQIPIEGQVFKYQYIDFLNHFTKTFSGSYLTTATRLLTMKRPDVFCCLTSKNKKLFCKDFSIPYSSINYQRYWDDVICRIQDSEWYLNSSPSNSIERKINSAKAAFLDAIYLQV